MCRITKNLYFTVIWHKESEKDVMWMSEKSGKIVNLPTIKIRKTIIYELNEMKIKT